MEKVVRLGVLFLAVVAAAGFFGWQYAGEKGAKWGVFISGLLLYYRAHWLILKFRGKEVGGRWKVQELRKMEQLSILENFSLVLVALPIMFALLQRLLGRLDAALSACTILLAYIGWIPLDWRGRMRLCDRRHV